MANGRPCPACDHNKRGTSEWYITIVTPRAGPSKPRVGTTGSKIIPRISGMIAPYVRLERPHRQVGSLPSGVFAHRHNLVKATSMG